MTLSIGRLTRPLADVAPWRREVLPWRRVARSRGGAIAAGVVAAAAGAYLVYELWRRTNGLRHRADIAPAVSRWEGEGGQVLDDYVPS
jgi:hypothetical protein